MIKLLLPLIVTVGLAAPATAAITTSQTLSGSLGGTFLLPAGFSTTLNFNPFNNPGEVLTSVKLSYKAGYQSDFGVTNPTGTARQVTLARGISTTLTGNDFNLADTNVVSNSRTVPRFSFLPASLGNYAPSVTNEQSQLAGNPVFLGPGPVSFAFSASQFGNNQTVAPNSILAVAIPNLFTATSFYDVTLTYESEAIPPIPEPASWAMMIAGFGLAGAALRRRRTAIA